MYKLLLSQLNSDKVLHFLYGSVLTLPFLFLTLFFNINVVVLGTLVAFIIGSIKELADFINNFLYGKNNNVEFLDIVATTLGGLYVSIVVAFLR